MVMQLQAGFYCLSGFVVFGKTQYSTTSKRSIHGYRVLVMEGDSSQIYDLIEGNIQRLYDEIFLWLNKFQNISVN